MDFTPQQQAAINIHDKNLIVVAGAGSGKTRVLVERYLTLLETHRDWSLNALVAITFTREAALEMRNRVRQALEDRLRTAAGSPDAQHWSGLLAQMDSARIDTIHGLCQTILRANAAEAGLDPGFEILDETDTALLRTDVVQRELQTLLDDDPHQLLTLFSEYDASTISDVLADPMLLSVALPPLPANPADLYAQWCDEWRDFARDILSGLSHHADFMQAINWQPDDWPTNDKLYASWQAVYEKRDALFNTDDIAACIAAAEHLASTKVIRLNVGSAKNWGDKETLTKAKDALRTIRDTLQAQLDLIGTAPNALDEAAAGWLIKWQRLLQRVQHAYRHVKQNSTPQKLDFDDLEHRAADLLTHNAAVRQRYQNAEFKHILVDEFQDTNAAQWRIVQALADVHQGGSLFVVGDQKQSIYGFRGADVSVFNQVREEIAGLSSGKRLPLSVSFRSHRGLIDIFNALFSYLLVRDAASPVANYQVELSDDDKMSAHRQDLPDAPALDFIILDKKAIATDDDDKAKLNADDLRTWEAYEIGQRLQAMHQQQDIAYNDMAILFQSLSHVTQYEAVFRAMGIKTITIAGRGYYNRQEVWDLLNLLRALHNPADNLSLAAALRSPMFGFSDDLLYTLRSVEEISADDEGAKPVIMPLWDVLNQHETLITPYDDGEWARLRFAQTTLNQLHQMAGRLTISELLREALSLTGYPAMLTALPDGNRRRRNIEKLVDIADASGRITLSRFTQYLVDLTDREVREGEATLDTTGAVKLMSVHASKGLEFPVVVLADAAWKRPASNRDVLIFDTRYGLACKVYDSDENKHVATFAYNRIAQINNLRDEAERKRLLYVAATRARDHLIISSGTNWTKDAWSGSGWLGWLLDGLALRECDTETTFSYAGDGVVRFRLPAYPLAELDALFTQSSETTSPKPEAVTDHMPPLMRDVPAQRTEYMGHIAATQLADLGNARHATTPEYYETKLRRDVLHAAPAQVPPLIPPQAPPIVSRRAIGEMVHTALRYWQLPDTVKDEAHMRAILRGYAWQQNLTTQHEIDYAISEALKLLDNFQRGKIHHEINAARAAGNPNYPEMPFVWRTGKRIIHGIIDMVFQRTDGQWVVLDYKTGSIDLAGTTLAAAANDHARRYYLQVGAYAAALQAQLNQTPTVYVHYIRYNHTVEIATEVWQQELAQLEATIGHVLGQTR